MRFERVAVLGVGLIGGSFALALKSAGACAHVVGAGRNRANLELARSRGILDSIAADAIAAAHGADLVLLAAPVAQFQRLFQSIAAVLGPRALVTDGGSTKRDVVAAARAGLGRKVAQFVPAHPIAGGEKSGAAEARADLFRGRRVLLTPLGENNESAVARVRAAWEACGASISTMSAEEHDALLGTVSHFPHLLAYALAQDVATRPNSARLFEIAGAGFRDFTRLASSNPEMWRDICMANKDSMLAELDQFERKLKEIRAKLDDGAALEKLFAEARDARDKWLSSSS
ncbi:MAG: prephenate dehydrogenase [Betaproteobacteria bacterium]